MGATTHAAPIRHSAQTTLFGHGAQKNCPVINSINLRLMLLGQKQVGVLFQVGSEAYNMLYFIFLLQPQKS